MAPTPAGSTARRSAPRRAALQLVIDGEARLVSRALRPADQRPVEAPTPVSEPRWGAALHAANLNVPAPRRVRRKRFAGLWASLGLQTGAALVGLAVLGLTVFAPQPRGPVAPAASASLSAGLAR